MKIVILTGSPRKKGNSNYLAEQFAKGANEAGHEVFVFDCVKQKVGGCLACDFCGMNGPCSQKDDFTNILRFTDLLLWIIVSIKSCHRPVLCVERKYAKQKERFAYSDGRYE